jgi:hypothetical protein
MEAIEIEQHKLIIKNGNELLKVLLLCDVDFLQNIISKSKNIIDNYNNSNLTIVDVSKQETGIWKSTIKKVVYGKYYNSIIKKIGRYYDDDDFNYVCDEHRTYYTCDDGSEDWFYNVDIFCITCKKEHLKREQDAKKFYKKIDDIKDELKNACNKTIFSKDLKLKCILLNRRIQNQYKVEPLFLAIKETIHIQILKTFQEQNEILITKYI